MRFFSRDAALITGLPLALLTALFQAGPFLSRIIDFLLTALVVLAIVGPPEGLLVGLARATDRRWVRVALKVAAVLLAPVLATAAMIAGSELPHGRWQRLPDPPPGVTDLAGPTCTWLGNATVVYGLGADRRLWQLPAAGPRPGQPLRTTRMVWGPADSIPAPYESRQCRSAPLYRVPRPPGHVVRRLAVEEVGADCHGESQFVLLANGQLWRWRRGMCAIAAFLLWLAGAGLVFVSAVWAVARKDSSWRPS